ncbi:MAG: hypothetical protein IPI86_05815 [Anaerolineales bacterium]|nr:hypothetical protein [Anaerolineales bacterium]
MRYIYAIILCMTLSACLTPPGLDPTPTAGSPFAISQEDNPYAPKPEDLGRQQAGVIITSINLSERSDLSPVRVDLNMLGSMPSACHELRVKLIHPMRHIKSSSRSTASWTQAQIVKMFSSNSKGISRSVCTPRGDIPSGLMKNTWVT